MSTKIKYLCPACGLPGEHAKGERFYCPECGGSWTVPGYREPVKKCPVCGEPIGKDILDAEHEFTPYGARRKAIFHNKCWVEYLAQTTYDDRQLQEEINFHEVTQQIRCPFCHESECIILIPWGNEARWYCNNCEKVLGENYVYDEAVRLGKPLPKCNRCGKNVSLCIEHDCKYPRLVLRGI